MSMNNEESPKKHVSLEFNPFDNTTYMPIISPLKSASLLVDEPRPIWKSIGKYNLRALDCLAKKLIGVVYILSAYDAIDICGLINI